ncbi:uncharacterized protein [Fopius arisanus]|uniref:Uncharacterized protein n=1 Tax=Fopius arisanus TaxID=64838 RepID=A0A9R1TX47_9HYME|nr:PREDICTED: uncharacterized protein LOC105265371 [Fopius arisanus]
MILIERDFVVLFAIFSVHSVRAQENAQSKVSDGLLECYNNTFSLLKINRLPHNIHALIAIIRKIEENREVHMDLRQLSGALLHRFRQDGIVIDPQAVPQEGVTPYSTEGFQSYRHSEMLKLIPGNALTFNNNSINLIERCTLHSMISSSIDIHRREDETLTCRLENLDYRQPRFKKRSIRPQEKGMSGRHRDVETLTPEQIESIKNGNGDADSFLPNSWYPPLPPNHPESSRYQMETSKCPTEGGVLQTDWGVVSGGPLLAGIAAAVQPQNVRISDLMRRDWDNREAFSSSITLDNKWIATLAGDLAEVALHQGPSKENYKIGTTGHWNSSNTPKYYFLNTDQSLEFTEAEVRGDLDGLILASNVASWYSKIPSLKLSQILDMYYSDRGVLNGTIRACNRRNLLTIVAPNDTTSAQTYRAAMVLNSNTQLPRGTISDEKVETFSFQAVNELLKFIPSSMNNDRTCSQTNPIKNLFHRMAVDLTIILDTNWPFKFIKPILDSILEKSEINRFAGNFSVINAANGSVISRSSHSILDFYALNESQYETFSKGFNLPKSLDVLKDLEVRKLNAEREKYVGGGRAEIVLVVPWSSSSINDVDREYSLKRIWQMREETPDVNILFMTAGSKERWTSLAREGQDIFSVGTGTWKESIGPVGDLVNRMKRIPKRLINSQCGADYSSVGASASFDDYLEPSGVLFYRMHPNYFYKTDEDDVPTVKVQGIDGMHLIVCSSRNPLNINSSESASCSTVTGGIHRINVNCREAAYIHQCNPLYLSITAGNRTSEEFYPCTSESHCRFPDMIKFTISYENLVCTSGTASIIFSPIFILLSAILILRFNFLK